MRKLKKVELHRHLELSLRHSTIKELAPLAGIPLKSDAEFRNRFIIEAPMTNLEAVLGKFLDTQLLLSTPEILERIAFEACEDAFQEGIRVLELRYAPTFVIYRHPNLSFETIHEAIVKGIRRAEKTFPMAVGLIVILQRILPVARAEEVFEFVLSHRDTFVGIDLADAEVGNDSKPFAGIFKRAREAGLGITVHSGEENVPKAPEFVQDAIDYLGAQRIGHGLQIFKSPKMMKYVRSKNVVLEICPTSNYLTQAVSSLAEHPIGILRENGVMVTINTDDPGIFDTTLTREYEILAAHHGFTEKDFADCNEVALAASFISPEKKSQVWRG